MTEKNDGAEESAKAIANSFTDVFLKRGLHVEQQIDVFINSFLPLIISVTVWRLSYRAPTVPVVSAVIP